MQLEIGFLIEYSTKKGIFEPISERKRAFVTQERLIELLRKKYDFIIWSARWINYGEYKINVGELPTV